MRRRFANSRFVIFFKTLTLIFPTSHFPTSNFSRLPAPSFTKAPPSFSDPNNLRSMTGISRSPVRRNDGFHRYLKPGALAQIRNSRINARSNSPLTRSLPDRVDQPSPSSESADVAHATPPRQTLTMEQMPDFLSKIHGPYRIGGKKLGLARSVLRTMMDLNPSPNSILESTSGNSNDVLLAH